MDFIGMLEQLGVDPQETIRRFCQNEQLLNKYLKKFIEDGTFDALKEAVDKMDYEGIERSAHTLKGVSANFGMKELSGSCSKMVEAVRANEYDGLSEMFAGIRDEYNRIYNIIETWEKEQ